MQTVKIVDRTGWRKDDETRVDLKWSYYPAGYPDPGRKAGSVQVDWEPGFVHARRVPAPGASLFNDAERFDNLDEALDWVEENPAGI